MRFFRLNEDVYIPGRWYLGEFYFLDTGGFYNVPLGPLTADARRPLRLEIQQPGRPLDFTFAAMAAPVASSALAQAMESVAGPDIQRVPVQLDGEKGFELLGSSRTLKCIDDDQSEYVKWTSNDHRADLAGHYRMVTRLRINPTLVPRDAHLFRPWGWPVVLLISETLKNAMEKAGCFGATFEDVTGTFASA